MPSLLVAIGSAPAVSSERTRAAWLFLTARNSCLFSSAIFAGLFCAPAALASNSNTAHRSAAPANRRSRPGFTLGRTKYLKFSIFGSRINIKLASAESYHDSAKQVIQYTCKTLPENYHGCLFLTMPTLMLLCWRDASCQRVQPRLDQTIGNACLEYQKVRHAIRH